MELYYKDKNINLPENINIQEITIINQSYLPILTKKDYCTIPRFSELSKYNEEALQKVDGFTIYNQNGMIEFEDLTDLTYQNLDEIVDINEKYVLIYFFIMI